MSEEQAKAEACAALAKMAANLPADSAPAKKAKAWLTETIIQMASQWQAVADSRRAAQAAAENGAPPSVAGAVSARMLTTLKALAAGAEITAKLGWSYPSWSDWRVQAPCPPQQTLEAMHRRGLIATAKSPSTWIVTISAAGVRTLQATQARRAQSPKPRMRAFRYELSYLLEGREEVGRRKAVVRARSPEAAVRDAARLLRSKEVRPVFDVKLESTLGQ